MLAKQKKQVIGGKVDYLYKDFFLISFMIPVLSL